MHVKSRHRGLRRRLYLVAIAAVAAVPILLFGAALAYDDMVSEFLGHPGIVDVLRSAGNTAQIPSRIGPVSFDTDRAILNPGPRSVGAMGSTHARGRSQAQERACDRRCRPPELTKSEAPAGIEG